MADSILALEPWLRGAVFICALLIMALWELLASKRPQRISRRRRWPHNLMIIVVDTLVVRLVFPLAAVGVALLAADRGWGLFNMLALPGWLAVLLSVVVLDVAIYFQHRLFHAVPWLWRLHRMHHADLEFDVTTGLRFHPLEMVLSMAIKMLVVALVGAPALAVLLFELLLNATSMFNHGNVRMPAWLDRALRFVLVTPDMHRVHHSAVREETDSNFGFSVPWWDRLFRTYRDQPAAGHQGMTIGLELFRDERELTLWRLLRQPFVTPRTQDSENN